MTHELARLRFTLKTSPFILSVLAPFISHQLVSPTTPRFISSVTSSVNTMLEALGWPTLEQRCQTCRLSMLNKILNGLAYCPTLKSKLVPLPSRQRCTHDSQFTLLTTRTQYRGSSFLPKTIRDWNSLPMEVVEAPTLDAFVSRVSN